MDANHSLGQPRVQISRSALLHNVATVRRQLRDGVKICAVLKADAYGHSAALVADALCNYSSTGAEAPVVDALAVATIEEAIALCEVDVPVMVLRPVENVYLGRERDKLEAAIHEGWTLTVCSPEAAGDVARIAAKCGVRARVQVMLDTGMAREGAPLDSAERVFRAIEAHASLRLVGVCTHFANSESCDDPLTTEQLKQFDAATSMRAWKSPALVRHAANTAAMFFCPESQLDMVRPGLGLYGIDPSGWPNADRSLKPVLKWTARLHMVRTVRKGESIGYGQTWTANRDTRIGLVPVGYADGYLRAFSNRAAMMVHGKAVPVVGRVSMDFTTIDLSGVPEAEGGDVVTILDNNARSPASVYTLANIADTVPYEIFCRIGARVARVGVEPSVVEDALTADEPGVQRDSA